MHKREIAWIVALVLLIGAYIHYFGHSGEKKEIPVDVSIRPPLQARRRGGAAANTNAAPFRILISLDTYYRLTSIKVSEADKQPGSTVAHVPWHLVSKTGSAPTMMFQYGQNIESMDQDLKGVATEPLVPGRKYLLEVAAGKIKGIVPFTIPVTPH